jgi:nitrile hydratase
VNGVHDLGGTDGLGPIVVENDEPVFHSEWEKAVFAMMPATFAAGFFNLDQFRYGIEQIPPAEYLSSRYYEHWLHTIEHYAVRTGAVERDELDQRTQHFLEHPEAPLPEKESAELIGLMETVCAHGGSARREPPEAARFAEGDRVRIADDHPYGHTRRPRYIRGHVGVIDKVGGSFVYPDTAAMDDGEEPQWVYTVRFTATELWGEQHADPSASIYIDTWEPYLESA